MTLASTPELDTKLDLALRLADEARAMALGSFRQAALEKNKSATGFDPTTEADIAIEKMMHKLIQETFPDHAIQGEELPSVNGDAAARWIIDPIDGTRNYYAGSLFWGVLIAFAEGDDLRLGVIDHPPTKERFVADKKSGLWLREQEKKPLQTRQTKNIKQAVLGCTTPQMFQPQELAAFNKISEQTAITLYGGNCYFYGLLALGQIDCVIEASLQPYDIAALVPIVEAAGGVITNWEGGNPLTTGQLVASATPELHEAVLAKLA